MNEEQVPQTELQGAQKRAHEMLQDPEFKELARRKNAISLSLTVAMMLIYFGFIFLLAFAPAVLSRPVSGATSGIPVGIGVIIFAWMLTGVYVRWANDSYDTMVSNVKKRLEDN